MHHALGVQIGHAAGDVARHAQHGELGGGEWRKGAGGRWQGWRVRDRSSRRAGGHRWAVGWKVRMNRGDGLEGSAVVRQAPLKATRCR